MNTYQQRIQTLIDYAHGLAMSGREIDMRRWTNECDTVGCLIGSALHDNLFNEPRFRLSENGYPLLQQNNTIWLTGATAISVFFGMPQDQAEKIFIESTTLAECLTELKRYFHATYPMEKNSEILQKPK